MIHSTQRQAQSGFAIGLILLVVVLIAAIIGAIALSSQQSSSNADRESARINASTLVQQAATISAMFSRVNPTQANNVVLSDATNSADGNNPACTNSAVCLFAPATGVGSRPTPPSNVFVTGTAAADQVWRGFFVDPTMTAPATAANVRLANINTNGVDLGVDTEHDHIVAVANLTANICRSINNVLYNTPLTTNPPVFLAPATTDAQVSAYFTAAGALADLTLPAIPSAPAGAIREGCYATSDATPVYYYIKVVSES